MCGFVGYFSNNKKISLEKAVEKIHHRGPDDTKILYEKEWGIAFKRLSIIDLSSDGMQPFCFDKVIVFVNGEIYNYLELLEEHKDEFFPKSRSDIEIIPFLYRKYGIKFLNKLNGMFSMVLIDERLKKKFLVRDRFGKKPLYYYKRNNDIFFSSEIKSLKKLIDLKINFTNVAVNLACAVLPQPLTLYHDLYSVSPGSYLEFNSFNSEKELNWYLPELKSFKKNINKHKQDFDKKFTNSINLRLRSDVPVGVFLSGGIDSNTIAYYLQKKGGKKIKAFTANIPDKQTLSKNNTDVTIPKKICKEFGWENIETNLDFDYLNKNLIKIIYHHDEIIVNTGIILFYALSETAKNNKVKVIMTGVGGDELFGGYPWQNKMRFLPKIISYILIKFENTDSFQKFKKIRLSKNLKKILNNLTPLFSHYKSLGVGFYDFMSDKNKNIFKSLNFYSKKYFLLTKKIVFDDFYNQMNYLNIFTNISSQNYMADMGCMKHSIENRTPFLDFNVVEEMMCVSDKQKIKNGLKSLLKDNMKNKLPGFVLNSKKSGPSLPIGQWIADNFKKKEIERFILKHNHLIEKLISKNLADKIKTDLNWLFDDNALRLFSIISLIIWIKINYEMSIDNIDISLKDIISKNF